MLSLYWLLFWGSSLKEPPSMGCLWSSSTLLKRLKSLLVQLIEYNILFTTKYDNVSNQFRKFLEQDL